MKTPCIRCQWAAQASELEQHYHDSEWGVPNHDERHLFEMLTLEGAQAGLSWATILKKREGYKRAFENFEVEKVASFDEARLLALREDAGIVRNRLKIESTRLNAQAVLQLYDEGLTLNDFLWQFVDGEPVQNHWRKMEDVPALTPASEAMSKALKKRGFKFVGSTICYALMQATGMVNDHTTDCFRYRQRASAD